MENNFSKLTPLDIEELKNKGLADYNFKPKKNFFAKIKKFGTDTNVRAKKGGKRVNSGRKKQTPTDLINFRIKADKKAVLKAKYGKELNKMFIKWVDNLLTNIDYSKITLCPKTEYKNYCVICGNCEYCNFHEKKECKGCGANFKSKANPLCKFNSV